MVAGITGNALGLRVYVLARSIPDALVSRFRDSYNLVYNNYFVDEFLWTRRWFGRWSNELARLVLLAPRLTGRLI